tara:strand:- start:1969 stop:3861 length:1893 start_codon:yes stop_codon:yes gene_type:complete
MIPPVDKEKPALLTLYLNGFGRQGEAIAEHDGKKVFVFGGIPGETVIAKVIADRRNYIAAEVTKVIESSNTRISPVCKFFGNCTGCQWQHIDYEKQLEIKRDMLDDSLHRIGGIEATVLPTLASPQQYGYRNHARFTVSKEGGRLGYVHKERRRHVEIDYCHLMTPWINDAVQVLQSKVAETTQLSLRYGVNTDSYLLQPTFQNPEISLKSGQKYYQERLLSSKFQVSSPSFFQVNSPQAENIARIVMDGLQLNGKQTVVDAYAGVSTFAVLIAGKSKKVIAVEESASALVDARVNTQNLHNVELYQGKTEELLANFTGDQIDAVILDPPRSGCMQGTLDALLENPPPKIVYISCDPETLARDLAILTSGPFNIDCVQPVDMFPQTYHIESVTILVRDNERLSIINSRQSLVLASTSPRRQEILSAMGIEFLVMDSGVIEPSMPNGTDPSKLARARAHEKAYSAGVACTNGTVIAADTVVEIDGRIMNKPVDIEEAEEMLLSLRDREHNVVTAVCVLDSSNGEYLVSHKSSKVKMRWYSDEEIENYIASGDPMDKAGAYAIQNDMFAPVESIKGCYLSVVGLPVCITHNLLRRFGIRIKINLASSFFEYSKCPDCKSALGLRIPKNRKKR